MLKQYALTVLNNYFMGCIEESQSYNKKSDEKVETSAPSKDNSQEVDLDVPW
jgi:hypothetical protein